MLPTPRCSASVLLWRMERRWRAWWKSTWPSWARWRGGWSRCWTWRRSTPSRTSLTRSTCSTRCPTRSSWARWRGRRRGWAGWPVEVSRWRFWESTQSTVLQCQLGAGSRPEGWNWFNPRHRLPLDVPSPHWRSVALGGRWGGGKWTLLSHSATTWQSWQRLTQTDDEWEPKDDNAGTN